MHLSDPIQAYIFTCIVNFIIINSICTPFECLDKLFKFYWALSSIEAFIFYFSRVCVVVLVGFACGSLIMIIWFIRP